MSKFIADPNATTESGKKLKPQTALLHADEFLNDVNDVAPPIHVSTTFRYPRDANKLIPALDDAFEASDSHVYSRLSAPSGTRLEAILSQYIGGYALCYASGLAAFHAALVHLNPKRLAIGDCYHGCQGVANVHSRITGMKQIPLDCPPEELQEGDVVHLETPLNPTGEAWDIKAYAEKAHARGAILIIDATFAPPPLQDPFAWGADFVMHSASKYIGGHSDMLGGVLVTRDLKTRWKLFEDRLLLGATMGNLEAWLGVRSVRTLELRVMRESENATKLVRWIQDELEKDGENAVKKVVDKVRHASLQKEEFVRKQMPNGFGPVFSIEMKTKELAKNLPSHLELFAHATSLGSVESLIEWRAMSDDKVSPALLRLSVGIENFEDLKDDLAHAFEKVASLGTAVIVEKQSLGL